MGGKHNSRPSCNVDELLRAAFGFGNWDDNGVSLMNDLDLLKAPGKKTSLNDGLLIVEKKKSPSTNPSPCHFCSKNKCGWSQMISFHWCNKLLTNPMT